MQNAKSKSGGVGARYLINRRERSPLPPFPIQKSLPMGDFKFGFIGELGHGLRRLRTFLKKGSKNSKNFEKALPNMIF